MRTTLKASLTAIMLTSVAAVPLATATTFLTADAAYAKSDKAKGGSKGKGAEKSTTRGSSGSKGKSGDRSASGGGHGGLDKFFGKITGKDKKATRTATAPAKSNAKAAGAKIAKSDPMHPSNLGNMNGALNSSPKAMLAHIRNGNTNGPVGQLAALAVARTNAYDQQDVIDLEGAFAELDAQIELAEYESLEEYLAAKEGIDPIMELDDAIIAAEMNEDPELQEALDEEVASQLEAAGYGTVEDYEADVMGITPVQEIEDELTALGYNEENGSFAEDRPSEEDVAAAEEAIAAEDDATASILEFWNKGDAASDGSDELLAALQAKIDANAGAIEQAKPAEEEMTDGDGVGECEEGAEGCEPMEEELAAAE